MAEMTAEARALRHFLDAQRAAVPAIVEGLDDAQLRTPVLPSGYAGHLDAVRELLDGRAGLGPR
jgi:hypothetical protein